MMGIESSIKTVVYLKNLEVMERKESTMNAEQENYNILHIEYCV